MHDTEWISLNYGAGPLECFLQRGEKQRISQHGYIKMNWYICFFFGSWILKWNKGDTCLNVPIQVLLCSERHFYLRDYLWDSSAIKLIVRTQKHPNLVPQITMFPRGPPGGTVGVLSSWEVSCCSSIGSCTQYSIFKIEFWKRLSWSIKIETLPPTPAPSFTKIKTTCVLKSVVEEKIKREAWNPGFFPVKTEKDDRKGPGLQL